MVNPLAMIKRTFAPRQSIGRIIDPNSLPAPYERPGYKTPEKKTAIDLLTPPARWPLIWPVDIHGYDEVSSRGAGQAGFTLTGGYEGRAGVSATMRVPLHEGRLFEKSGTYILIALPATDEEMVRDILAVIGR